MDTDAILRAAEDVHDEWFSEGRIDWQEFIDRLERHTGVDFGSDMDSTLIRAVKRHISRYRKLN